MEFDTRVSEADMTEYDIAMILVWVMGVFLFSGAAVSSVVVSSVLFTMFSLLSGVVILTLVDRNVPFEWKMIGRRKRVRNTEETIPNNKQCFTCGDSGCEGVKHQRRKEVVLGGLSMPMLEEKATYDCIDCLESEEMSIEEVETELETESVESDSLTEESQEEYETELVFE